MRIRVYGTPQNCDRRTVCRAIRYFARTLMSPALIETLTIRVDFRATEDTRGYKASLIWEDRPERAKRYRMVVRETLSYHHVLRALAHEMVHVKQYATGQMRDYVNDPDFVRWENEPWEFADDVSAKYWFAPWEIEAYGMEVGLWKLFLQDDK